MKDRLSIWAIERAWKDAPSVSITKKEFREHFKPMGKKGANALFDFISTSPLVEKKQRGRIQLKNPFGYP